MAIAAALAAAWSCGAPAETGSVFTSIRTSDCTAPSAADAAAYAARDLGVQQCPAPNGWRLLLVSSDANSWIDLTGPRLTWSGEKPIVYESPIGNFPSVDDSPIEWRRDDRGQFRSLIFRVSAQDPETLETRRSMVFVLRLQQDAACVIGRVATDGEARTLADSGKGC